MPRLPLPAQQTDERPARRTLITLTPLIDVVFILLVFFMLASNLTDWRSLQVTAPAAGSAATMPQDALRIELYANGSVRLGGEALDLNALAQRLTARLASDPAQALVIEVQDGAVVQGVIDVLERLARIGARNVSLQHRGGQ